MYKYKRYFDGISKNRMANPIHIFYRTIDDL